MRRETKEMLGRRRDANAAKTVERAAAAARARAAADRECAAPVVRVLPPIEVVLYTMTEAELHDATYHAVSVYLCGLSGMTKTKAHMHAGRIAAAAILNARASDYLHRGPDPRASRG